LKNLKKKIVAEEIQLKAVCRGYKKIWEEGRAGGLGDLRG